MFALRQFRCRAVSRMAGMQRNASIHISDARLQEFMNAEITHFASHSSVGPVQLAQIVAATTKKDVAALTYKHIPTHFASRIKHIEELPQWDESPELVEVHSILQKSFRNLRLVEPEDCDYQPLTDVISDLRKRHKAVIPLLSTAIANMRQAGLICQNKADLWLDTFLLARISTEMLTLHYMNIHQPNGEASPSGVGILDSKCFPGAICQAAANNVSDNPNPEYCSVPIVVTSHNCSASLETIEFSFLPTYFRFLVEELLKNSVRATFMNRHNPDRVPGDETIHVTIGSDWKKVLIKISDRGGGIPPDYGNSIFSYLWTSREVIESPNSSSDPFSCHLAADSTGDPLAGLGFRRRLGMGLPLSRLYAKYLGGSLQLMSIPGVGVDTYLTLNRIDAKSVPDTVR